MNTLLGFKGILDKRERTYGFQLRFLGLDLSILTMWWVNDWKLLDLRIPAGYGAFCQVLFLALFIGRLPDDSDQQTDSE